jgi:hypothetical protein
MDYDESFAIIATSQRAIAENTRSLDATLQSLSHTHRLAMRLEGICLGLLVVSILGIGGLLWSLGLHVQRATAEHHAIMQQIPRALLEGRPTR